MLRPSKHGVGFFNRLIGVNFDNNPPDEDGFRAVTVHCAGNSVAWHPLNGDGATPDGWRRW